MKKLMFFLHGKQNDVTDNIALIEKIAAKLEADLISIESKYPYKIGRTWFNRRDEVDVCLEQFKNSLEYIEDVIVTTCKSRGVSLKDVIICGRSQGAYMGICAGLDLNVGKVISISADFRPSIPYAYYSPPAKSSVVIQWIESGKDAYLDYERRQTYKLLEKLGYKVQYMISPNSEHTNLSDEILELI